jgi:hypothetical protein
MLFNMHIHFDTWDSSVAIAMAHRLDSLGSFPSNTRFFILHSVQIDPGTQPAFYPMGLGGSFMAG